jgi:carboxymethylenebutenolidase
MNDMMREDLLALVTNREILTRREFVAGSHAAGFALAVQPVCAQTMITTDTRGINAGEVKIATSDGEIPAYRAMPANAKNAPVILVVQEIFGVHEHIKDVCRRFAKLGYMGVAPELYHRQGDVSKLKDNKEIFAKVVSKVPDAQVMSDLDAVVAWAGKNGADSSKLGITGFCWGGRITEGEGRRGLVRPAGWQQHRTDTGAPAGAGRQNQCAGARALWWRGCRHTQ